jgi:hypothetical protein
LKEKTLEITKTITYLQYIQGLGLWFLTPLSAIIQLYPGGSIYTRYKENVMIVTSQEDKHYESTEFFLSKLFFAYLSISSGNFITLCLLVEKRLGVKSHNPNPCIYCKYVIVFVISVLGLGLELWCLTPLSTIFQLYHGKN